MIILILQNLCAMPVLLDDVSAAEKRASRRRWIAERDAHEQLAQTWTRERYIYEGELRYWDQQRVRWREEEREEQHHREQEKNEERARWAREKQQEEALRNVERARWEEERQRQGRIREEVEKWTQGAYWTQPWPDANCTAFGKRMYRAMLKEMDVCAAMPISIHGAPLDSPQSCYRDVSMMSFCLCVDLCLTAVQDQGNLWASWLTKAEEPSCTPYWGAIYEKVSDLWHVAASFSSDAIIFRAVFPGKEE